MNLDFGETKYEIKSLAKFKKQIKKIIKQGNDINKFREVLKAFS